MYKEKEKDYLLSHIDKSGDCWIWTGKTRYDGYGYLTWNGKAGGPHRAIWEVSFGEIPQGLSVLHKCDNPPCCNPAHLFLGTQLDNIRDRHSKGRSAGPKGERAPKAKLTDKAVAEIRRLGASGTLKHREIAEMFGVSRPAISSILRRDTWKHIP